MKPLHDFIETSSLFVLGVLCIPLLLLAFMAVIICSMIREGFDF